MSESITRRSFIKGSAVLGASSILGGSVFEFYVDGHPVHKPAKRPVVKKVEEKVDNGEDFPF